MYCSIPTSMVSVNENGAIFMRRQQFALIKLLNFNTVLLKLFHQSFIPPIQFQDMLPLIYIGETKINLFQLVKMAAFLI